MKGKQRSLKTLHRNNFIRLNDMLLLDIVYLDNQLCVVNTNSSNDNDLSDSVLSYFKRSPTGFEKIFDLKVPQHLSSSSSSESSESIESSDEDWIHEPSVINWANEVCETNPKHVVVPEWAQIAGLDLEGDMRNSTELRSEPVELDFNQNNFSNNWTDDELPDEPVIIPEWAKVPDSANTIDSVSNNTFNWADELVSLEELKNVNIPEWARIPGFDFIPESDDNIFLSSVEENSRIRIENWADDISGLDGYVEVPEWALIPGLDFEIETSTNMSSSIHIDWSSCACDDDDDIIVPEWANIDIDMHAVYVNKTRINNRSYHIENVWGLKTIWE